MKKSQNMLVWLSKLVFGPALLHRMLRLAKSYSKAEHLLLIDWIV
jgi:hypothetical protein